MENGFPPQGFIISSWQPHITTTAATHTVDIGQSSEWEIALYTPDCTIVSTDATCQFILQYGLVCFAWLPWGYHEV